MKKVAFLSNFGSGKEVTGGQIGRALMVGDILERNYGKQEVTLKNTYGGWINIFKLPFVISTLLLNHKNVAVMPSRKGIWMVIPLTAMFNLIFHRRIHYTVVGGWLPAFSKRHRLFRKLFGRFHLLYMETDGMERDMKELGVKNAVTMYNCKSTTIVDEKKMYNNTNAPFPVCVFTRITKLKGIAEAVEAVNACNKKAGKTLFTLDLYGKVQQEEWFTKLMENQPNEIQYKGLVDFDKCTPVLKNYFAMIFPTYYDGEGFPQTLIDAMAAGLPVVATNWNSNGEVVEEGKTGFLVEPRSASAISEKLLELANAPERVNAMRGACRRKAMDFQPDKAMKLLLDNLL